MDRGSVTQRGPHTVQGMILGGSQRLRYGLTKGSNSYRKKGTTKMKPYGSHTKGLWDTVSTERIV